MSKFSVIKVSGKQYLVKEADEILVDKITAKINDVLSLDTLLVFDDKKLSLKLGLPNAEPKVKVKVLEHLKGEKINILKFKSKVRFTKRQGFRAQLTKLKVISN